MATLQLYKDSKVQVMDDGPLQTERSFSCEIKSEIQWTTQIALTLINSVRFTSQISTYPFNCEGESSNYDRTTYRNI